MKTIGDPIFSKDADGKLLSRIGTIFFRTPGLVTKRGVHAMQRLWWIEELNAAREKEGLPPLTEAEESANLKLQQDIEKKEQIENMRNEFISNVSHELKTPMTSMKVLAASLLSEENVDAAVYREFLEDITSRDQKMFKCVMTIMHTADTKEQLDVQSLFGSKILHPDGGVAPLADDADAYEGMGCRQGFGDYNH